MATINSLYNSVTSSILQFMTAKEIDKTRSINKYWHSAANNHLSWKYITYELKLNPEHMSYESPVRNRKFQYDYERYAKNLANMHHCHRYCRKLSISMNEQKLKEYSTNEIYFSGMYDIDYGNGLGPINSIENRIRETMARNIQLFMLAHKQIFRDLISIKLNNCIITPEILNIICKQCPNLERFEYHLLNDKSIDEYYNFTNVCYNLISLKNLTHLELTGPPSDGSLDALIKGIANSKIEFLNYTLSNKPSTNMSLFMVELAKSTTLKTLILIPFEYGSKDHLYHKYKIVNSNSITSLNSPLDCEWIAGGFENLIELVNNCQSMYSGRLDPHVPLIYGQTNAKYFSPFTEWLINNRKLQKLCLLNLDNFAINAILDIIANHNSIHDFTAIDLCLRGSTVNNIYRDYVEDSIKFTSPKLLRIVNTSSERIVYKDIIKIHTLQIKIKSAIPNDYEIINHPQINDSKWDYLLKSYIHTE